MSAPSHKGASSRKGIKVKSLSLQEKVKVLARIDAGASLGAVCAEFDIKSNTFYDIKKNKEKIRGHAHTLDDTSTSNTPGKRIKLDKTVLLDASDDPKIGRIIRSESDVKDLQGDLDRLNEWVVRWQMEFNIDKCRVMIVGNLEGKILTTDTT